MLLYVVSPERYRDNKAWQLLLAEGAKHAWLFVMNQWDRGQREQFDDFKQQLAKAGFDDPLIVRTSCTEPDGDEFSELLKQLRVLAGRQNLSNWKNAMSACAGSSCGNAWSNWRNTFPGKLMVGCCSNWNCIGSRHGATWNKVWFGPSSNYRNIGPGIWGKSTTSKSGMIGRKTVCKTCWTSWCWKRHNTTFPAGR